MSMFKLRKFRGGQTPFFTDCLALLGLSVCLIIIILYYLSPLEQSHSKMELTRAQKYLKEIVKLDQEKQELSLQLEYEDV